MPFDAVRARAHVEELAARHDVELRWSDRPEASFTTHRVVFARHPARPFEYLKALHELGHCMSPRALFHEDRAYLHKEYDDEVLCEAAAWAWAARNAAPELEIPPTTWKHVGTLLAGYIAHVPLHVIYSAVQSDPDETS